jgi:hypothetical protein
LLGDPRTTYKRASTLLVVVRDPDPLLMWTTRVHESTSCNTQGINNKSLDVGLLPRQEGLNQDKSFVFIHEATQNRKHVILHTLLFAGAENIDMINITLMISIFNSIFTIVLYTTRWTKLDLTCICFEEFLNQHNCSIFAYVYICNRARVMGHAN